MSTLMEALRTWKANFTLRHQKKHLIVMKAGFGEYAVNPAWIQCIYFDDLDFKIRMRDGVVVEGTFNDETSKVEWMDMLCVGRL